MVDAEVAVLADAFGVERSVGVLALGGFLSPALSVVAVLTHSIGVVWLVIVAALGDLVSVLLLLDIFALSLD